VESNPNYPEVFGPEWWPTRNAPNRVWGGSHARLQRITSTAAETIEAIRLSGNFDTLHRAGVHTMIDVIEDGQVETPQAIPVDLAPVTATITGSWRNEASATGGSDLAESIAQPIDRWPVPVTHPAASRWITTPTSNNAAQFAVDAAAFGPSGQYENARVTWVEIRAILSANSGFRRMRCRLRPGGTAWTGAGGSSREVHFFGAMHSFWFGELTLDEGPFLPADIYDFRPDGDSRVEILSQSVSSANQPRVQALALRVWLIPEENRSAVGVWRRPETPPGRLANVTTDMLVSVPDGSADWAKEDEKDYWVCWRQSVSPAWYGPVNADDIRWMGAYQDLGPGGEPPGVVWPFHPHGRQPAPDGVPASWRATPDFHGWLDPETRRSRAVFALALVDDSGDPSVDSIPYRAELADIVHLRSSQRIGQRLTPAESHTYAAVRFPATPPPAGNPTLRVRVFRVSDDVQIGGTATWTGAESRFLRSGPGGIRYHFLAFDAPVSLVQGVQYEVRWTTTSREWFLFMPDTSIAPEVAFGALVDGGVIGTTHLVERKLNMNLVEAPDPVADFDVALTTTMHPGREPIAVDHPQLTWTPGAHGADFDHDEVERLVEGGDWELFATINAEAVDELTDHEAPREREIEYRITVVLVDGRRAEWVEAGPVEPETNGRVVVLTSNQEPDLEVAFVAERESSYTILTAEADEVVMIHGSDNQVVFREAEDRGIGWQVDITVHAVSEPDNGGAAVFDALLAVVRNRELPYVTVMDHQGTVIRGHVAVEGLAQVQPAHLYSATLTVTPTHSTFLPLTIEAP
jgi:hypothetical protein